MDARVSGRLGRFVSAPVSASACLLPDNYGVIVYHDLPPSPLAQASEIVILDVAFKAIDNPNDYYARTAIVPARVRRVVRGRFAGDIVHVRLNGWSCDHPFLDGTAGMIIGVVTPDAEGRALLHPLGETVGDRVARGGRRTPAGE